MRIIIAAVAAVLMLPAHAAMYKWIDAQGRTQYSDTPPPPDARKVEERKFTRNTIETSSQPFAVQEAAKRNPVTVWISDCGDLCTQARNYLAKRGVPHSVRNPSRQDEQDAWKKASGGDNSIPLLIVGSLRTLKGFDESEWNSALDAAGYPRNAPSLKPQAIPAADAAPGKPAPSQAAQAPAPEKK